MATTKTRLRKLFCKACGSFSSSDAPKLGLGVEASEKELSMPHGRRRGHHFHNSGGLGEQKTNTSDRGSDFRRTDGSDLNGDTWDPQKAHPSVGSQFSSSSVSYLV